MKYRIQAAHSFPLGSFRGVALDDDEQRPLSRRAYVTWLSMIISASGVYAVAMRLVQ